MPLTPKTSRCSRRARRATQTCLDCFELATCLVAPRAYRGCRGGFEQTMRLAAPRACQGDCCTSRGGSAVEQSERRWGEDPNLNWGLPESERLAQHGWCCFCRLPACLSALPATGLGLARVGHSGPRSEPRTASPRLGVCFSGDQPDQRTGRAGAWARREAAGARRCSAWSL